MKCLKCLKDYNGKHKSSFKHYLKHINKWGLCKECNSGVIQKENDYSHNYYTKHKKHYARLQKNYREQLTDSYVANVLVDRTTLKAKDIPQEMVDAKRQHIKMKRMMKEGNNETKKKVSF